MKTIKLDEFKEKLKELMEEYDAEIGLTYGYNEKGVYGQWMYLDAIDGTDKMYAVINEFTL